VPGVSGDGGKLHQSDHHFATIDTGSGMDNTDNPD
jgi:hypothetical protein